MNSEQAPERFAQVAVCQMEVDGLQVLAHPATDLDDVQAQRVQLHAGHTRSLNGSAVGYRAPLGRGMLQQAELIISPEAVATQAIGKTG